MESNVGENDLYASQNVRKQLNVSEDDIKTKLWFTWNGWKYDPKSVEWEKSN